MSGKWRTSRPVGDEVYAWHISNMSLTHEQRKSLEDQGYEDLSFRLTIDRKGPRSFFLNLKVYKNASYTPWSDHEIYGDTFRYECEQRASHFMKFAPTYLDVLHYHFDYKKRDEESRDFFYS